GEVARVWLTPALKKIIPRWQIAEAESQGAYGEVPITLEEVFIQEGSFDCGCAPHSRSTILAQDDKSTGSWAWPVFPGSISLLAMFLGCAFS
ncbi:MAG: hypothetical protein WAK22_02950, partial [Candidatus Sulfotelmatobacter sp.]